MDVLASYMKWYKN